MFIPHTMFWGEFEIQTIATMDKASTLDHVWPTTGLINFELTDSPMNCFILAVAKLIAISFTVAGGYRGGYRGSYRGGYRGRGGYPSDVPPIYNAGYPPS